MKKLLLLFFILPLSILGQSGIDPERLDLYLNTLEEKNKAITAVAISKGGEIVYEKYSGYLSPTNTQRFNATTKFRVGSISKTFTATVIFQLIEEGKLSLDTKLSSVYPDFLNGDKITIAHLLSHQSGIHNYTDESDFASYMTVGKSKEEMLKIMKRMSSDFEPGSNTSYSNSGYFLLGLIIESVTGKTYTKNITDRIISKLELKETSYGDKIENDKNEATSMLLQGEWITYPYEWDMSTAYSAGAVVSTPRDLNVFMRALFKNELVSEESVNKMKEIIRGLGHGVFAVPFYEKQAFGHNGHIDTFDSGSYYFESDDVNVTVISTGLAITYNDILVGVLSLYFEKPFDIPTYDEKSIELDVETLKTYEGDFSSSKLPLKISVKVTDGQLTAQATGQNPFPLTAISETEFKFDAAGIVMIFGDKVDGKYTTFILKQGGQQFPYTKDKN